MLVALVFLGLLVVVTWLFGVFEETYVRGEAVLPDGRVLRVESTPEHFGPESRLRLLDARGEEIWSRGAPHGSGSVPFVDGDAAYLRSRDSHRSNRTVALDLESGRQRWLSSQVRPDVGVGGPRTWAWRIGDVVVERYRRPGPYLRALNPANGAEVWRAYLPRPHGEGRVHVLDIDSTVHVLGPDPTRLDRSPDQWALRIDDDGSITRLTPRAALGACFAGRTLLYVDTDGALYARGADDTPIVIAHPGRGRLRCFEDGGRWVVAWSSAGSGAEPASHERGDSVYDIPPERIGDAQSAFDEGCALLAFDADDGAFVWGRTFRWGALEVWWDVRLEEEATERGWVTVAEPDIVVDEHSPDGLQLGVRRSLDLDVASGSLEARASPE